MWGRVYQAVTTENGRYVQGGGCTTVGVAGLVQSGGFGSFSRRYGTAAASLLGATAVTADGAIRRIDEAHDPDLLWALKGGGGGTFAVVSNVTLRLHDLPDYAGAAVLRLQALSAQSYRRLLRRFVGLYADRLFDEHWGESVSFSRDNRLSINMVSSALDETAIKALWEPFVGWIARDDSDVQSLREPILAAAPARRWWDGEFWRTNVPSAIVTDPRPGRTTDWWWAGDSDQVGEYLYGFESLWLPQSLLADDASQERLTLALFAASRQFDFALHFNKGMAGTPPEVKGAVSRTAMNPVVLDSFALAICADAQGPAYPGVAGHEPDVAMGRRSAAAIHRCMNELRAVAPAGGAYVSESNYFERDWQHAYWGANYERLATIKRKYDPDGLFEVHNGVA